jgi:hypothetical protein
METQDVNELRSKLKLPLSREQYISKYKDDPDALALLATMEESDAKCKKMEVDIGKMAMILNVFADTGNWEQQFTFKTGKKQPIFLIGNGLVGAKLIEWLSRQMELMPLV